MVQITFRDIAAKYPGYKDYGAYAKVSCPLHSEKTASMTLYYTSEGSSSKSAAAGHFKCFGCGQHGSIIDWLVKVDGLPMKQALGRVYGDKPKKTEENSDPGKFFPPTDAKRAHNYFDDNGQLVVTVYRRSSAPKTLAYQYQKDSPTGQIKIKSQEGYGKWPTPRPIYGLETLKNRLKHTSVKFVLITQGEKDVDYLINQNGFIPPVISYSGGDKTFKHSDWSPLVKADKPVVIWPDKDASGIEAAQDLAQHLIMHGVSEVRIMDIPDMYPKGFDASASQMTAKDALSFIDRVQGDPVAKVTPPAKKRKAVAKVKSISLQEFISKNDYFHVIGIERTSKGSVVWVYVYITQEVFKAEIISKITPSFLLALAPLEVWLAALGLDTANIPTIVLRQDMPSTLITVARNRKIIELAKLVGRGAAVDNGQIVYNFGNKIINLSTGEELSLVDERLQNQYDFRDILPQPKSRDQAATSNFYNLVINKLPWVGTDGLIFLSFIACSLLGGASSWRPQIWFNAPTDLGKSRLISSTLQPLLTDYLFDYSLRFTAPGIERAIASDSLPVILDEGEAKGGQSRAATIESILELIRMSTQNTGGSVKADGSGVMRFNPRATFMIFSNTVQFGSAANENRIELIGWKNKLTHMQWMAYEEAMANICKKSEGIKGWVLSQATTYHRLMSKAQETLDKMKIEGRVLLRLSALFSGAWIMKAGESYQDLQAFSDWVHKQASSRTALMVSPIEDAQQLINSIIGGKVMHERNQVSIGLLVARAAHFVGEKVLQGSRDKSLSDEMKTMLHNGLIVEPRNKGRVELRPKLDLVIGTNHPELRKMLSRYNYEQSLDISNLLRQHKHSLPGQRRSMAGVDTKTVRMKLEHILDAHYIEEMQDKLKYPSSDSTESAYRRRK